MMERCIILDGSPVIRKVTKRILGSNEMTIIEAETGAQALKLARNQMPNYIIIDHGISDMKIEDLIRQLRSMDKNKTLRIISCMTQLDLVAMTRAKRAGADDFMLKPFDRNQLIAQFKPLQNAA